MPEKDDERTRQVREKLQTQDDKPLKTVKDYGYKEPEIVDKSGRSNKDT